MEWISIDSDKKPNHHERVIAIDERGYQEFCSYYDGYFQNDESSFVTPTHWMKLPDPPKD